jgi:hypothetical protein
MAGAMSVIPFLGPAAPWVAAITLGLATYFTSQLLSDSERQTWVKARALAEGLKSECYKYVTGAPPYDTTAAAQRLAEKVRELQRIMGGIIAENVSAEERIRSIPNGAWKVSEYIEGRVREQIDGFYRPAIFRHRHAVNRARLYTLVFGAAAVVFSVLGSSTKSTILVFGSELSLTTLFAAVLGTITTAAGAIATWFQSGHHQQLIQGYQGAVSKLELLLAQTASSRAGASKQLVIDAEAVFQAEHAAWLAEWQVQAPTDEARPEAAAKPSAAATA